MRFRKGLALLLLLGAVYLSGCNRAPEPEEPEWTLTQETAAVLPDGESVSLWHTIPARMIFTGIPMGQSFWSYPIQTGRRRRKGEAFTH